MLLIIAGSSDGAVDEICKKLKNNVFRLNYDLLKEYEIFFKNSFWSIKNPAGHEINSDKVTSCFWWKAFFSPPPYEDNFINEELKYLSREIYNWCQLKGKNKGNPPDFHNRLGKLNILNIAKDFFKVPDTYYVLGKNSLDKLKETSNDFITKSLSSASTNENANLLTTQVKLETLHPSYPWLLLAKIDSNADVTVFICEEKYFSYARDRTNLKGLDWRGEQTFDVNVKEWNKLELSIEQVKAIKSFCKALNVSWGRIDFMLVDSALVFLEFNANGQWFFLDYFNNDGIVDSVVNYLYP